MRSPVPQLRRSSGVSKSPEAALQAVLALDRQYWEAEKAGDWASLSALVAAEYYGVGDGVEIDRQGMQQDFPKIKLLEYKLNTSHVRLVGPDLAVVSYTGRMKECFGGQDISGQYWYSTTWRHRDTDWKLVIEEEVRLDPPTTPSR